MSPPPLTPHDYAEHLVKVAVGLEGANEADTRHTLIDDLIHKVLCWPKLLVKCESFIDPGYADYILLDKRNRSILFIEAKKAGYYFSLPPSFNTSTLHRKIQIKTLITDSNIKNAVDQVRGYCLDKGCEFAAITNGMQWIFFKTFARDQDWRTLDAFVIEDIRFFSEHHTRATQLFSYSCVTESASLANLLGEKRLNHRPRYYPKEKVAAFDHEVTANYLAPSIRPIIERYFGIMNVHDSDFMESCYVNTRDYQVSEANVKQLMHDSLSPYFRDYNVKDFFDHRGGGDFGTRIRSSARERKTRDVIVLFGGKGSGKSTFISRLLYHNPPHAIKSFTQTAVIDLLECPETPSRIEQEVWEQLITKLDRDKLLDQDRDALLSLFRDRYSIALKQSLAGLLPKTEAYNLKLNNLLEEWKNDKEYCACQLSDYWKARRKGLVIVLDNTDQFSPENQDYCFTLAHNIATKLDCLVVISMREERFHYSKLHGTLDAFQNSGFHLSSPDPAKVFKLRLEYVRDILNDPPKLRKVAPALSDKQTQEVKTLINIFRNEFMRRESHLKKFIKSCAHGNMRLALDFFRQFALSGYLRVDEMVSKSTYTLQTHQVLRPMMVPYRLFYDETKSSVPNVFQVRSEENGSHFTGLRILHMLASASSSINPDYVSISKVRSHFSDTFGMLDDAERVLGLFLERGVVESNNRVDEYNESIDSVKITAYGIYIINDIVHSFSYLDLICMDCGIHDQGVAESLALLGNNDINFFLDHKKRERMDARIQKVQTFLQYLKREEDLERELYQLESSIMEPILAKYEDDEARVLRSARKNFD